MVSRADVERWRLRGTSLQTKGDLLEAVESMADALIWAMERVEADEWTLDGEGMPYCPVCGANDRGRYEPPYFVHRPDCEWVRRLRVWRGEEATSGHDAVDGARDGA